MPWVESRLGQKVWRDSKGGTAVQQGEFVGGTAVSSADASTNANLSSGWRIHAATNRPNVAARLSAQSPPHEERSLLTSDIPF
ncbi:MAG: hypothetical protein IPM53_06345 [Anaerolineaceae bacterium]|nr:hypothetical protein [Anaerolineaceae bacterium]